MECVSDRSHMRYLKCRWKDYFEILSIDASTGVFCLNDKTHFHYLYAHKHIPFVSVIFLPHLIFGFAGGHHLV